MENAHWAGNPSPLLTSNESVAQSATQWSPTTEVMVRVIASEESFVNTVGFLQVLRFPPIGNIGRVGYDKYS